MSRSEVTIGDTEAKLAKVLIRIEERSFVGDLKAKVAKSLVRTNSRFECEIFKRVASIGVT